MGYNRLPRSCQPRTDAVNRQSRSGLPAGRKDLMTRVNDWFYNLVFCVGWPAVAVSSSPVVLHRERARRDGAYILAANHLSPYDVPCLIKETPRVLDFVSVVEVFQNPMVAWFYGKMGAFPLDRGRVDTATTRIILDRLRQGRVVALFPEGRIRSEQDSVLNGGSLKPGVLRLARLAKVPIIPTVVVGARAYHHFRSWLPLRRTVYGINYGEPIFPQPKSDGVTVLDEQLRAAYRALHLELMQEIGGR